MGVSNRGSLDRVGSNRGDRMGSGSSSWDWVHSSTDANTLPDMATRLAYTRRVRLVQLQQGILGIPRFITRLICAPRTF
jgi:hypothetical protein